MYYVYVDWTVGPERYAYYVGQGTRRRVGRKHRNKFHDAIAQKHGLDRVIVLETPDRSLALAEEIRLIAELSTFHGDNPRGTNFTRGGDGATEHIVHMTDEWREKIASSLRGRKSSEESNRKRSLAQLGKKKPRKRQFTQEERDRIYGPRRGHDCVSRESRARAAEKLRGRKRKPFTEEHRKRLSEALKAYHATHCTT